MPKFEKGHSKKGGRIKGVENKVTQDVREAFKNLLENNLDNMTSWLQSIATDNPSKAFELMLQLAEYHIPKLQRTEMKHEGEIKVESKTVSLDIG